MAPILNNGRYLTTDNIYTSVPLAKEILNGKITRVGTYEKIKDKFLLKCFPINVPYKIVFLVFRKTDYCILCT